MSKPTRETVIDIIANKLPETVEPDEIKESSRLNVDLGLDVFDRIEILLDIENECGVDVSDDEFEACATVGQVIELVRKLKGEI